MPPELLAAILNFSVRFGIDAATAFLSHHSASIDDAIEALRKAKEKSLDDYIREDAQQRAAATKAIGPENVP